MYTKKVLDHFRKPHNLGKIKNPDGIGKVGNLACGDIMYLYIKVRKNQKGIEFIKDIKFETFGCVAAIAVSSIITDLIKGKTIEQAINTNREEIIKSLGGLPPMKIHCSILAIDALSEAIYDYLNKNKKIIPLKIETQHKRIEKERIMVEKKYAKWVKAEKDSLEETK